MKKVLLVCGSGASSGFLSKNIRKAAQDKGHELDIVARSDTAVDDYIDDIDLLLVAPHLDFLVDNLKEVADEYDVPVVVAPKDAYGTLDGEGMLRVIMDHIQLD